MEDEKKTASEEVVSKFGSDEGGLEAFDWP